MSENQSNEKNNTCPVQLNDFPENLDKRLAGLVQKNKEMIKAGNGLEQFLECDIKECKYYNAKGRCAYETCRMNLTLPKTSDMILKICQVCGNEFATAINTMPIQICPTCRQKAWLAEGHPHKCIFCGKEIDMNPSMFFAACSECFEKIKIVATGNKDCVELFVNEAHCDSCPDDDLF